MIDTVLLPVLVVALAARRSAGYAGSITYVLEYPLNIRGDDAVGASLVGGLKKDADSVTHILKV